MENIDFSIKFHMVVKKKWWIYLSQLWCCWDVRYCFIAAFFFPSPCFGRQAPVPSVYLRAAKGFFKARDLKTEQHAGVSVEYTEQNWEILMLFIRRSKADVFWAQMSKIKHLSEWISNRFKLKLEVLIACKSGSFWKGHRWKMWTLSMWKRSNSEQV